MVFEEEGEDCLREVENKNMIPMLILLLPPELLPHRSHINRFDEFWVIGGVGSSSIVVARVVVWVVMWRVMRCSHGFCWGGDKKVGGGLRVIKKEGYMLKP